MPKIINTEDVQISQEGHGWKAYTLANSPDFGTPAMLAKKWVLEPNSTGPLLRHTENEQMLYVVRGSGAADLAGERFPLEAESMMWLEPGDEYQFNAGPEGLEILQAIAPGE